MENIVLVDREREEDREAGWVGDDLARGVGQEVRLVADGRKRVGTNCRKVKCIVLFFIDFPNENAVTPRKAFRTRQQTWEQNMRRCSEQGDRYAI